ncbi:MAG: hypothetical protein HKO53_18670 [Gemmatimonadetes bacterium]|nr:hypothetical protein [Gemmatimonadota bacterium]
MRSSPLVAVAAILFLGCAEAPVTVPEPSPSVLRSVEPLLVHADAQSPLRWTRLGLLGSSLRLSPGDPIELSVTLDRGIGGSWLVEVASPEESLGELLGRAEPQQFAADRWMPPVTLQSGRITLDLRGVDIPTNPTASILVAGILDADSDATGTRMRTTGRLLAAAGETDDLRRLHAASDGDGLDLTWGDIIAITGLVGSGGLAGLQFQLGVDGTQVDQLLEFLEQEISAAAGSSIEVVLEDSIVVLHNHSPVEIENLRLSVAGRVGFNQVMTFGSIIPPGATATITDGLLRAALETDPLSEIHNDAGDRLNLEWHQKPSGEMVTAIEIGGTLGREGITPNVMSVERGVTTVQELLDRTTQALSIANEENLWIDEQGYVLVSGDVGLANSIGNISLREEGNLFSNLNASINFQTVSAALDAIEASADVGVVSDAGDLHTLRFSFVKRTGFDAWDWEATADGIGILGGQRGVVHFSPSGLAYSLFHTDGSGAIVLDSPGGPQEIVLVPDLRQLAVETDLRLESDGAPRPRRIVAMQLTAQRSDGASISLLEAQDVSVGDLWVGPTVWWAPAAPEAPLAAIRVPRQWPLGFDVLEDQIRLTISVERGHGDVSTRSLVLPAEATVEDFTRALADGVGGGAVARLLEDGSIQLDSPGVDAVWIGHPTLDAGPVLELRRLPPLH